MILFSQFTLKSTKAISYLFLVLALTQCKKNTQKSKQSVSSDQEVSVLDFPKQFPLDSLLPFNSEKALREVFGDYVKRSVGSDNEGTVQFPITLLFPDSKNQVVFYWADTLHMQNLEVVSIDCSEKKTDWKTKEGITYGTTVKELEQYNDKPFVFWGFEWDYGGLLSSWRGGRLEKRKIIVALTYSNTVEEVLELLGDKELYSNLPLVQKADVHICGFSIRK